MKGLVEFRHGLSKLGGGTCLGDSPHESGCSCSLLRICSRAGPNVVLAHKFTGQVVWGRVGMTPSPPWRPLIDECYCPNEVGGCVLIKHDLTGYTTNGYYCNVPSKISIGSYI